MISPHADFAEISRVVFIKIGAVVVLRGVSGDLSMLDGSIKVLGHQPDFEVSGRIGVFLARKAHHATTARMLPMFSYPTMTGRNVATAIPSQSQLFQDARKRVEDVGVRHTVSVSWRVVWAFLR